MGNFVFFDGIRICLIVVLVYLAYFDLRTFRLPDVITLPLVSLGLLFNGLSNESLISFQDSLIGAILGYVCLWLLNLLYRIVKKQAGIGMGDAK